MAEISVEAIEKALQSLTDYTSELGEEIVKAEKKVDKYEDKLERTCAKSNTLCAGGAAT